MSISLQNVSFRYSASSEHDAIHIPSWHIDTGEKVFLHGPSGSGKSTLLNILSGVLTVSAGEVTLLGQRLDRMSQRQRDQFRANHIGYVFQQFNLIDYLSPIDNIRLAAHFSKTSRSQPVLNTHIEQTLTLLNIESTHWHKPTIHLSIGQQQRIAIARALINRPELLIVDEPTSSLDHNNRDAFIKLLMNMVVEYNITLIFVSHDESLSKHFSRVDALPTINQTSTTP